MNKLITKLLVGVLFVLGALGAKAQFAVTTNSGSGLAATYTSLANAITALNAATITSAVVITCPTGTETAPIAGYNITATGTSTNTITIEGNGAANSIITAFTPQASGIKTDAIFKIVGGDYVTIQNFTLQENSANTTTAVATNNMTEFGIGIFLTTATNGAQNNTIQNNTISLGSTYQNAFGIFSTSSSSSTNTTLVASATAGTNSNNKFYSNTISNVAYGMCFICEPMTATLTETGTDIGGSSSATANIITFGKATTSDVGMNRFSGTTPAGINFRNGGYGNSIRFNSITSNSLAYVQSSGVYGVLMHGGGTAPVGITYTSTISDNTVNITNTGATATIGIDFGAGISTGTIVGSNNTITLNQTSTAASSGQVVGINANYASATNTCSSNTIVINETQTTGAYSGGARGITIAGAGTTLTASSNNITINQTSSGTGSYTGSIYGIDYTAAATTINSFSNTILVNQTTSVVSGIATAISAIRASTGATTINIGGSGTGNTITLKQAFTGLGTYGSGIGYYVDLTGAAHGTVNVNYNTFNTTGSSFRAPSTLYGIRTSTGAIVTLKNINYNTMLIDKSAISANGFYGIADGSTAPSTPQKIITNNSITVTNLAGTGLVYGIYEIGGPSTPALTSNFDNNTINFSGANTGQSIGIILGYSKGTVSNNSITINNSSTDPNGIWANQTGASAFTITGNTISLTSNSTAPTGMYGIAGGATGPFQIYSNTFSALNLTGIITTSPNVTGISVSAGTGNNIYSNVINNTSIGAATSSGSPLIRTIFITGGASTNAYKNKIYGITTAATGANTLVSGVTISGGGTSTNAVYNNLIGDLTASAATNTDAIRGINITSTTASTTNNIYYNTVYITGGGGTNFGATGIFHTASTSSTTATLNLRNNIIFNDCTPNGTGLAVAYRRSSGAITELANYASTSNNNNFYAGTPGASNLIYSDGTSTAQTITAYKTGVFTAGTIAPRDAASFSDAFSSATYFQSTTGSSADFLKYNTGIALQVESGAGTGTGITDDYIGTSRSGSTPDVGAWELAGIAADLTGPTISYTSFGNTSCLTDRTLSPATITDASGVNIAAGTRPRLYYRKTSNANTYVDNTSGTDGWKYVEATGTGGSPFSFTTDYSLLFGGAPIATNVIEYFVVAQDSVGTPNVGINTGTFATAPTSVDLITANFGVTGANSYTLVSAGLSGTVTVGAAGTYTSITQAAGLFDAINTLGLSGNVTVNILDASVAETGDIALNAVNYNACTSGPFTILIKPDVAVTATLTGSSATGLIKLNGADYVTIDGSNSGGSTKNLTIVNTSVATSTSGIWVSSLGTGLGATNNTIKNSIIQAGANGTASNTYGIYAGGTSITTTGTGNDNDNLTIDNNTISKAYYGIYAQATSAGVNNNLTITNNTIGSSSAISYVTFRGLLVSQADSAIVRQNTVFNIISSESVVLRGMEFGLGVTNSEISRNMINSIRNTTTTGFRGGQGISVATANPANMIIANNVIYDLLGHGSGTITNNALGIQILSGGGYNIYYNSVNLSGTLTTTTSADLTAAMYIATAVTNVNMRNNVFATTVIPGNTTTGKTYGIYSLSANTAFTTINYNDFYAPGTSNRYAGFLISDRTTLADIQSGFGQNVNSLVVDPLFNSNTNLSPQIGSPLTAVGDNSTSITIDYNGVTRTNPPTIGAYDVASDVTAPVITYTALSGTCLTTDITLTATITDVSGVPTAGVLMPRIYYKKDAGAWLSSQGVLSSGTATNGTWTFTIVAADMGGVANPNVISYYVIAQDVAAISNITSNPSAGLVATDVNTVSTAPTTPNTYLIQNTLAAGTYTVGGAGVYSTLTAAVTAYNTSCLGGAIVFELLDANYTTLETFPIAINANADASATNTLTIKPASGVTATISGSAATSALIKIASKYVTIDGSNTAGGTTRDLTITNTSTTTPNVILIGNSGTSTGTALTNVTLKNTILINGVNTATAVIVANNLAAAGYFNTITIQNNSVQKAYIGIYALATAATGNGSGLLITGNDLNATSPNALSYTGIFVQGVDSATVSNNNIANITSSTLSPYGVVFTTGTNKGSISGNTISALSYTGSFNYAPSGIASTATTATNISINDNIISDISSSASESSFSPIPSGIYISSKNTSAYNNKIYNIKQTNSGGEPAFGINLSSASTTSGISVYNNFIFDIAGYGYAASSIYNGHGIGLLSGGGYNLYNNTINMNTNQTTGVSSAIYIYSSLTTAGSVNIRNNIFANTQTAGATAANRYAIYSAAANTIFGTIDHNDYYSAGTNLGYIGSTARVTLADIVTGFGGNANSISALPTFTSATDLHLTTANCTIDNKGSAADVTTDIDNQTRDLVTPDMGADEFSSAASSTLYNTSSTTITDTRTVASLQVFRAPNCERFAALQPNGASPVSGSVTARVYKYATMQTYNSEPYVQRVIDITPATGASSATGIVTLYYTQTEFDDFNTANGAWPDLPTGPSDATGIANLRITKYAGTPTVTPSAPGTNNYSGGTSQSIDPVDADIVWNVTDSRWEITLNNTGFSGFYIHTGLIPLAISVNYLTGTKQGTNHNLNWKVTCTNSPSATMVLERSGNNRGFMAITTITADAVRCAQPFNYVDASPLVGINYYRLRITDAFGKVTYSNTIAMVNKQTGIDIVGIVPNPVTNNSVAILNVASAQKGILRLVVTDVTGRQLMVQTEAIIAGSNQLPLNVAKLAAGSYQVTAITEDGKSTSVRFIKQ